MILVYAANSAFAAVIGAVMAFCFQGKSTEILGFVWTNVNEIVFITDNGIEFYQVSVVVRC